MTSRLPSRPYVLALAVALMAATGPIAPRAGASTITTNCVGLQTAFDNSDPNDVVVLTQMCVGMSFDLPDHRIVFRGQSGDGLDGTGTGSALLTGGNAIGTTVIRDLTFRDATSGALDLGGAPQVLNNRFINNDSGGGVSGGVSVDQDAPLGNGVIIRNNLFGGKTAAAGNTGSTGGAVYVSTNHLATIEGNVFRNNSAGTAGALWVSSEPGATITVRDNAFNNNHSDGQGGAMGANLDATVRVVDNVFRANRAGPNDFGAAGGALAVQMGSLSDPTLVQSRNLFVDNRVVVQSSAQAHTGGAEHISNNGDATIRITDDRFIDNRVGDEGYGGGLFIRQADLQGVVGVTLNNAVIAGNSAGAGGDGGGIGAWENCAGVPCETNWTLNNTTVAANTVGTGGTGRQMYAEPTNTLTVRNSIVYGNGSAGEVTGFDTPTFVFSDACGPGGAPRPGNGNICKPPRLADAADGDVHQTRKSPTRDKGRNSLVPSTLKRDFEGDARIIDSHRNGTRRVDMGADERRAKPRIAVNVERGSVIIYGKVSPKNTRRFVHVSLGLLQNGRLIPYDVSSVRLNRRSRYRVLFRDPVPGTCNAVRVRFDGSSTTFPGTVKKRIAC